MMNKQTKKLAEQAGFHLDEYSEPTQRKVEKLSELIVKDILRVVAAHALNGDGAVDVFVNLKRLYERTNS